MKKLTSKEIFKNTLSESIKKEDPTINDIELNQIVNGYIEDDYYYDVILNSMESYASQIAWEAWQEAIRSTCNAICEGNDEKFIKQMTYKSEFEIWLNKNNRKLKK